MYVAFFARRAAFSLMSMSVMLWSHARLFFWRTLSVFLCVVRVFALWFSSCLSVFLFQFVCLFRFVGACLFELVVVGRVILALWGMRLLEVTMLLARSSYRLYGVALYAMYIKMAFAC